MAMLNLPEGLLAIEAAARNLISSGFSNGDWMETISPYLPRGDWRRDPLEAMTCREVEDSLKFGIQLFEAMKRYEADVQKGFLERRKSLDEDSLAKELASLDRLALQQITVYQVWLMTSEKHLGRAKFMESRGHVVDHLAEFETAMDEARCIVENHDLEAMLPPLEILATRSHSGNPDPERYRD